MRVALVNLAVMKAELPCSAGFGDDEIERYFPPVAWRESPGNIPIEQACCPKPTEQRIAAASQNA